MRIAVLMSGQPRHMEQSAWWWQNKIFPQNLSKIHVDYFLNLWDDGTSNLSTRAKQLYNAKAVEISDYNTGFHHHRHLVKMKNKDATDWHLTSEYVKNIVCYQGDEFDSYAYNFPGMFLGTARIAETFEPYKDHYDIVIKTRTDAVLNPMQEQHWGNLFTNMGRNPVFKDCIFSPWLRIRNGLPFFGDLCFVGKTDLMFNFMHKMDESLVKVASTDKHLLSDYLIDPEIPFGHWMWSRLSIYSRTDWLALSVVWPVPFGCALIRKEGPLQDKSFQQLEKEYNDEEQRRHDALAHNI